MSLRGPEAQLLAAQKCCMEELIRQNEDQK